jgi:hypothetical protein
VSLLRFAPLSVSLATRMIASSGYEGLSESDSEGGGRMERYKGYLDGEGGEAECVVEASPRGGLEHR